MPDREQDVNTGELHVFPGKQEVESRVLPGRRESRGQSGNERSLSPEREEELWRRLSALGDEDARDEIIIAYRPLVFWLARKFRVRPSSYQDLIQEGMVALIRAVDKFEPERHLRFTTYAFYRIKGQMVNFLQRSELKAPIPVDDDYLMPEDSFAPDSFETLIAVSEEMHRLPAREEDVVQALLVEGRDAKDVARKRGIDISHVYRLKRNGVAKLRKRLSPEGDTTNRA
ncbi:sigma-70 family RNA polymerase sigma factor [Aminivibrio sp.]|jgi:RNA polymerase sporulation-specific sigma factor|uniref:sigma-70 family RNA polymerase sigma factor n=1 Tax=Aminivibrio sp. TaxID=1872489 RepID=UPI001A3859F2|nr:sigma-70 family RNA polymerase sigma factor [Aminivibrio sp.]MBL3540398.1 sigma-70 family RNA polymerase sigma factor [Aminivibrio sp.]MDK2959768.1 polymerase sporulation-specific sigma factor [Synergistaceae bacterium]